MVEENGSFPERIRASFPKKVWEARQRANLTQERLAAALQLQGHRVAGKAVVSDWERGRAFPKFGTFLALCEALNQPPSFFFGGDYAGRPGPTQEELIANRVGELVQQLLNEGLSKTRDGNSTDAVRPSTLMAVIDDQTLERLADLLAAKLADRIAPKLLAAIQRATLESIQAANEDASAAAKRRKKQQ